MKLYELTDTFNQLFELIDEEEFDLDTLEGTLQVIEGEMEVKVENIARMIKNWEAQAAAMKTEENRLEATRTAIENRIGRMKQYLLDSMVLVSKDKIPTAIGNVCRQKNPLAVDVLNLKAIPYTYIIVPQVEPKVDKKAILEHYKSTGEITPGTQLRQGYHLRIR